MRGTSNGRCRTEYGQGELLLAESATKEPITMFAAPTSICPFGVAFDPFARRLVLYTEVAFAIALFLFRFRLLLSLGIFCQGLFLLLTRDAFLCESGRRCYEQGEQKDERKYVFLDHM